MRLQVGSGIDNYLNKLQNLDYTAPQAIGRAIYEGADIVADAIKANIQKMPVDDTPGIKDKITGIKSVQKKGLLVSFGISPSRNDGGYINVKAGFDGYNTLKTKKYPQGQPNAMIARTFESGNSFTKKIPFVAPAVRATKDAAESKMAQIIDAETSKIMK